MAIVLAKTYAAFKAADADAQAAAEEIAGFENRLTDIKLIKETMATKAWVLGQTIVLLGGMAALLKILH
jgi:hypothetical protein